MNRLVLALLILVTTVQGALAAAMSNPDGRSFVSLDGMWNAIVDPYETGLNAKFFNNAKPKSKSDLIEYDFDRAGKLRVPGDWNTQRESLLFYEGPIWYQKNF
jgi:beta-glucuronidase